MLFGFNEPDVPSVEADDIKKAIDSNETFILLDVRTPGEFSRGKIAGAINVPVDAIDNDIEKKAPDKGAKIFVYCLSGSRSTHAVSVMQSMGYTNVYNMSHGLLAWRAKYFPVVQ